MDTKRYTFRRQYVFGPRNVTIFPGWKTEALPDGNFLSVHPDLPFTIVEKEKSYLVVLGYIVDPGSEFHDDSGIISSLLMRAGSFEDLFSNLEIMGGRYIMIAHMHGTTILFSDATGFRQTFYYTDSSGRLWCASQPSVLAELFGLCTDECIERELFSIPMFNHGSEYWYPGILTAYKEVSHLLPNHYLDITAKRQIRYWPRKPITSISCDECIEQVSPLLRGLFRDISNRFSLAVTVTAGLDSRLLLAASKEMRSSVHYLTHTHRTMGVSGIDIVLPSIMLPELGLRHHVIFHSEKMDPDFERIFRRNVTTARVEKGINAYAMHCHFEELGEEMVVANGIGGEITRSFFNLPKLIPVNGNSLARLTGMAGSPCAVEQFDMWLSDASSVTHYGISVLDLFYWEQRVGNWAAMAFSEYDISYEGFSPFSCRRLLELLLGVDKKYRLGPRYEIHTRLIEELWPETMHYAINPAKNRRAAWAKNFRYSYIHSILKTLKYMPLSRHPVRKSL